MQLRNGRGAFTYALCDSKKGMWVIEMALQTLHEWQVYPKALEATLRALSPKELLASLRVRGLVENTTTTLEGLPVEQLIQQACSPELVPQWQILVLACQGKLPPTKQPLSFVFFTASMRKSLRGCSKPVQGSLYLQRVNFQKLREAPKFVFQHEQWQPELESRKNYTDRALHKFKTALGQYLDDVERKVGQAGLVQKDLTTKYITHLDWLVRRQVEEEPFEDIAYSSNATPKAVGEAVRRLRRLLDLPRLPGGRPKTQ